MSDNNEAKPGISQSGKNNANKEGQGSSDLVVGSVTFVIFIIFMTAWMYFTA